MKSKWLPANFAQAGPIYSTIFAIAKVVTILLCGAVTALRAVAQSGPILFQYNFNGPNKVLCSEFANTNSDWDQNSGTFFQDNGAGSPGEIDRSSTGTDSAVFRLTTRRNDFENVAISATLLNEGLTTTSATPAQPYDGWHVYPRYQDEATHYVVSINRRSNVVVIKKKTTGGSNPINGGTYYPLTAEIPHNVPYGVWQQIAVTITTDPNTGWVRIQLYDGNTLLLSALDDGSVGGPPITGPGRVGIRGDNCRFRVDNFTVTGMPSPQGRTSQPITNIKVIRNNPTSATLSFPTFSGSPHFFYISAFPVSPIGSCVFVKPAATSVTDGKMDIQVSGLQADIAYNFFAFHSEQFPVNWSLGSNTGFLSGIPEAPRDVVAIGGDSEVTITWRPVPGATSYNLYRCRCSDVDKQTGYQVSNVTSPHVNTGSVFMNGTTYYFVVTAVNASGESVESARVSATPHT